MKIPVVKFDEQAILPKYETKGAAGFDLASIEDVVIAPLNRLVVRTGLGFAIPEGFEMQVRPRSGNAAKLGLTVLNTPGTIDSDYRGEVKVILYNSDAQISVEITKGMRIAQGVIAKVEQAEEFSLVDSLDETDRGTGGFGSTGK